MRFRVQACDLGMSSGRFGACSIDTHAAPGDRPPLSIHQRGARAIVGLGFFGLAGLSKRVGLGPAIPVVGWFGATHLLAAAVSFDGCPELGVVPSLLLRRKVATECGPWEWMDARLGLAPPST
jgi:hypothetical protein